MPKLTKKAISYGRTDGRTDGLTLMEIMLVTSTRTATMIKLPAVYTRFSTTTRSPRTNAYNLLPWLQEEEPPQPLSESLPPIRRGAGALEANCNSWWLTYVKGQTDKLMALYPIDSCLGGFNVRRF